MPSAKGKSKGKTLIAWMDRVAAELLPLLSIGNEPSAPPSSADHAIRLWATTYPGVRCLFYLFQTNVVLCLQIELFNEDEQMLSDKAQ
jgi:hypothetical protein